MNKVESNGGRLPESTSGLPTHMHTHIPNIYEHDTHNHTIHCTHTRSYIFILMGNVHISMHTQTSPEGLEGFFFRDSKHQRSCWAMTQSVSHHNSCVLSQGKCPTLCSAKQVVVAEQAVSLCTLVMVLPWPPPSGSGQVCKDSGGPPPPSSPLLQAMCMIMNNLIFSLRFHDCKANRVWSELTCMSIHQAAVTGNTAMGSSQEPVGLKPDTGLPLSLRW